MKRLQPFRKKKIPEKTHFFLVPRAGTFVLKSFHTLGHLTNNLIPGAGYLHLTNSDFKSLNVGDMLSFRIDRYITKGKKERGGERRAGCL